MCGGLLGKNPKRFANDNFYQLTVILSYNYILGLFLGISILSVIEFVYYASLRKYWIKRREREEKARQQLENQKIVSIIPTESNKFGIY